MCMLASMMLDVTKDMTGQIVQMVTEESFFQADHQILFKTLKELLATDSSDLVMAMIHKFREVDLTETFPELNVSPHILVMTDEAHRSQYSMLGANLDKGIPNSARIAYTGTPIDKTERAFGDYIDNMRQRNCIVEHQGNVGAVLTVGLKAHQHILTWAYHDIWKIGKETINVLDAGGTGGCGRRRH